MSLARERYARVLVKDPENFDAIRETGLSYLRERANDLAAEWLDRAHRLHPKDERLVLQCGFTHVIRGDRAAATRYLEVLRDLGSQHVVRLEKALEGLNARQPPPDSTGD